MESKETMRQSAPDRAVEHLDRYTEKTRRKVDNSVRETPLSVKTIRAIEGVNRRALYGLLRLFMNNRPLEDRIPISELRSICVIPPGDAIGDMIVTLPILRTIKRRNPDCEVGTLFSNRNASLLRRAQGIDHTYFYRDRKDFEHYKEIRRARAMDYQVVLNMHFNRMTEYGILSNIIGPNAVKITTTHKRKDLYARLFNLVGPFRRNSLHVSQLCLALLERAIDFGDPIELWESRPEIELCPDTETNVHSRVNALLKEHGATWYICCNVQARVAMREWGAANLVEFSKRFTSRYPDSMILFTSSPSRSREIMAEMSGNLPERTAFFETSHDLLELASLVKGARLLLTPDTSLPHFATSAGCPAIVLYPSIKELALEWVPIFVPTRIFAPAVLGEPVSTITVDDVWRGACDLLDGKWTVTQTNYDIHAEMLPSSQAINADRPLTQVLDTVLQQLPDGSLDLDEVYKLKP